MDEYDKYRQELTVKLAESLERNQQLQAENAKLKEFARFVIRTECWSMFEHDGGSIQDLLDKLLKQRSGKLKKLLNQLRAEISELSIK